MEYWRRAEAHALDARKAELGELGVRLVAVVKEAIPEQICQFRQKYWSSELYVDEELGFFKALGGGTTNSKGFFALVTGTVRANNQRALPAASPVPRLLLTQPTASSTSTCLSSVRVAFAGANHYLSTIGGTSNLTGEGWILGGLYVVRRGGDVEYGHQETTFGDTAPLPTIMLAASAAAAASSALGMYAAPVGSARYHFWMTLWMVQMMKLTGLMSAPPPGLSLTSLRPKSLRRRRGPHPSMKDSQSSSGGGAAGPQR